VLTLVGGSVFDLLELGLDVGVVDGGSLNISENELSFVDAILNDKPSRRLGEPWNRGEEDDDEDELKG
jgi:hypothetical protein